MFFKRALLTTSCLILLAEGTAAFGQYDRDRRNGRNDDRRDGRYDDRDRDRGRGGRYSNYYNVVERVKRDVSNMAARVGGRVDNEKRDLFRDTVHNLERFQVNAQKGDFDKDRLDGAIDEMKRLVGSDQIPANMKDRLQRNIEALRDFRADGGSRY